MPSRRIVGTTAFPTRWRRGHWKTTPLSGDHDEGTPNYKGIRLLLRAIGGAGVRQEKKERDKAEWNMRMAYGYQYLHGQEQKLSTICPAVGRTGPRG